MKKWLNETIKSLMDLIESRPVDTTTINKQKIEEIKSEIEFNPQLRSYATPVSEDEIRVRAYYKWEAAGKPLGQEDAFWAEAKQELINE